MRADIKMLCVTTCGAVLELKTYPYYWITEYLPNGRELISQGVNKLLTVADPNAFDAGQCIDLSEVVLVARVKHRYTDWPKTHTGRLICNKGNPMPKTLRYAGGWEHDDVHETDADSDNYIEYKCHSCGHVWRTEMPD